jgi:hypothetical protein
LCQEFILQWSKRTDALKCLGVKLVMVSIGEPHVGKLRHHVISFALRWISLKLILFQSIGTGKELISHLELRGAEDYLYVGKC